MIITKTEYNWSIKRLAELLKVNSKFGSAEDLEIMDLARKVEDYEMSHEGEDFEATVLVEEPMVL